MRSESNLGAAPVRVEWTTHERSMAAYDQLPAEIKRALAEASYDMSNEYVLELWRDKGLDHTLAEIRKSDPAAPIVKQPKRERSYR